MNKRTPSFFLALLPILIMVLLLGVGYALLDLRAEPLMLISAVFAGLIAVYLGYSWDDIMNEIVDKLSKTLPAIFILIIVGALIGTWMIGGTIPMMVYYGLKIISPKYLAVTSFLVTAIISITTGTSWGSAGTIGVALMGVASGMNANLPLIAGAVVSGAYFGDKMSPLSDTTNLAPIAAGSTLYDHIFHMFYTTIPGAIIAIIVYTLAGVFGSSGQVTDTGAITNLLDSLSSIFTYNLWVLIPPMIILYGSVRKLPTIPVMLLSSGIAILNALFIQGFSLQMAFDSIISGFDLSMLSVKGITDIAALPAEIPVLLQRGGMLSMLNTVLIAFCAYAFAGTVTVTGSLDIVLNKLLSLVHGRAGLIGATILSGITAVFVTSNGQLSILLPGEMFADEYIKQGLEPKNLSRTLEDSATVVEPIVPWTAAGHYMATTLGVPTLSYLPWAILCYTGVIFAMIYAITGFGIKEIDSSSPYYNQYLKLNGRMPNE